MKRPTLFIGCSALVILLAVAGIAGFLWIRSLPDTGNMVPEAPISVNLTSPLNGYQLDPGENTAVKVQAMGIEPLTHLELWVDGQLFAQKNVQSKAGEDIQAFWPWHAMTPGPHTLVVRAIDAKGRTGQSTQVTLNVSDAKLLTQLPAVQDETLNGIAAQFNLPAVQIAAANPGLDPNQPLNGGQPVNLPPQANPAGNGGAPTGNPAPPSGPAQKPGSPPSPLLYWFDLHIIHHNTPQTIPDAPALSLATQACKAQLFITPKAGSTLGFVVYRWASGAQDFQKIATLGSGQEGTTIEYDDPTPLSSSFNYQYYVSAFNTSGQNPSAIVALQGATLNCKPAANGLLTNIKWTFTATEPVDKSYCYESSGNGKWQRIPQVPFQFFPGQAQNFQSQLLTADKTAVQLTLDCWGWQEDVLKYLGEGQSKVEVEHPPQQITIIGANFKVVGAPQSQTPPMHTLGASCNTGSCVLSPPQGLRQTTSLYECETHQDSLWGNAICKDIVNDPHITWDILIWEWNAPSGCWPGQPCPWIDKIDGYQLYLVDSQNNTSTLVKTINDPNLKIAAFDSFPWAGQCYAVRAFANTSNGTIYSKFDNFCNQSASPKTLDLIPDHVLTTVLYWTFGCGFNQGTGGANVQQGFDYTKEILVGDDGDTGVSVDCDLLMHNYDGGAHFNVTPLPENASFQKATLSFDQIKTGYTIASDVATNQQPLCATDLDLGTEDWTTWDPNKAIIGQESKTLYSVSTPYTNLNYSGQVDVSDIVFKWLQNPASNHGFIFLEDGTKLLQEHIERPPGHTDKWACWNILGNLHLKIQYYAP